MQDAQGDDVVMRLASVFRTACETVTHFRHPSLQQFPRGACGEASVLLGHFLRDHNCGEWTYQWRIRRDPFQSHAWIIRNGLIVDITADQFDEIDEPVIVSCSSTWHENFGSPGGEHVAGLEWYDRDHFREDIHADYAKIRSQIGEIT